MKPAPFRYCRPYSLEEACRVLSSEEDARIIAGGQTLTPMLAMRLARPAVLVDIHRLDELIGLERQNGSVVIKAATRQVDALKSSLVREEVPLLAAALPFVGHPPTRNRGTVGGSIANADPSAEISLVAVTLDAEIVLVEQGNEERLPAEAFFIGPMLTMASPTACLTQIVFPARPAGRIGVDFQEVSSRRSDFAFASAAAQVELDENGVCTECRLGIGSVGDFPVRVDATALIGTHLAEAELRDCTEAVAAELEVISDLHASADYRRRAAATLARRALVQARERALKSSSKEALAHVR